jgi:hypothetical protein
MVNNKYGLKNLLIKLEAILILQVDRTFIER